MTIEEGTIVRNSPSQPSNCQLKVMRSGCAPRVSKGIVSRLTKVEEW